MNPQSSMRNPQSIDPIISRLRPRSVGEILDQSFRLYRRHFLTFLAITAVVFIPVNIAVQTATVFLQGSVQDVNSTYSYGTGYDTYTTTVNEQVITLLLEMGAVVLLAVASYFLQGLSQGALTSAVADSYLDKPVSFSRGYGSMFKRIGPLLGVIGLQFLIGLAIFSPLIGLFILSLTSLGSSGGSDAGVAAICLMFMLAVPLTILFAYIFIRLNVVVPAVMVEDLPPTGALRRSWQLVFNSWWRTAGIVMLLNVLISIIAAGPGYLILAVVLIFFRHIDLVTLDIITGSVSTLVSLLITPIELIAITLYYFDLRVRKEGFDLETAIVQRYWPQGNAPMLGLATATYGAAQTSGDGYARPSLSSRIEPPVLGQQRQFSPTGAPTVPTGLAPPELGRSETADKTVEPDESRTDED